LKALHHLHPNTREVLENSMGNYPEIGLILYAMVYTMFYESWETPEWSVVTL
jgi:hypothetical protein